MGTESSPDPPLLGASVKRASRSARARSNKQTTHFSTSAITNRLRVASRDIILVGKP